MTGQLDRPDRQFHGIARANAVTLQIVSAAPPVPSGPDWLLITSEPLPVTAALAWAVLPSCGGVVMFCGTVRDHSEGRSGVVSLEYESYEEHAQGRLGDVVAAARARWPVLGRVAMLHRVGKLGLGEVSVVVVVSAPHRPEAFEAARYCIDTLKRTVPIWKREEWDGGSDWATCSHELREASDAGR